MSKFIKLQEYDRQTRRNYDLLVNIDQIVAISVDMNLVYTTAKTCSDGVFIITKDSMLVLIQALKEREENDRTRKND